MTDTKTDFLKTLFQSHEHHLARLKKVAALPRPENESFIPEPLMRDENRNVRRDGVLNLPARCDFGIITASGVKEKNLAVQHKDADIAGYFELADLDPTWVSPFAWNALDVQFRLDQDWPNFKPLRNWYLEWCLPKPGRKGQLVRGIVHSLSGPTPSAGGWIMSLDLGTAPPDAVLELLTTLADIGANKVSLGACVSVDAD